MFTLSFIAFTCVGVDGVGAGMRRDGRRAHDSPFLYGEEKKYRMRAHTPQVERERERKILLNILELTGYSQPRQSSVKMQKKLSVLKTYKRLSADFSLFILLFVRAYTLPAVIQRSQTHSHNYDRFNYYISFGTVLTLVSCALCLGGPSTTTTSCYQSHNKLLFPIKMIFSHHGRMDERETHHLDSSAPFLSLKIVRRFHGFFLAIVSSTEISQIE